MKSNCSALFDLQRSHQTNLFTREHSDIYVQCTVPYSPFVLEAGRD